MPKFEIYYYNNGKGNTIIEADTQQEAIDSFYDGDYTPEDEETLDSGISTIEIIKEKNND